MGLTRRGPQGSETSSNSSDNEEESRENNRVIERRLKHINKHWNNVIEAVAKAEAENEGDSQSQAQLQSFGLYSSAVEVEGEQLPTHSSSSTVSFSKWLELANAAVTKPSNAKLTSNTKDNVKQYVTLRGKNYRLMKIAYEHPFAKWALLAEVGDSKSEVNLAAEHEKEFLSIPLKSYRKAFNYSKLLTYIKRMPVPMATKKLMYVYLNKEAQILAKMSLKPLPTMLPYLQEKSDVKARVYTFEAEHIWLWIVGGVQGNLGRDTLAALMSYRRLIIVTAITAFFGIVLVVLPDLGCSVRPIIASNSSQMANFVVQPLFEFASTPCLSYGNFLSSKSLKGGLLQNWLSPAIRLFLYWMLVIVIRFIFLLRLIRTRKTIIRVTDHDDQAFYFKIIFCGWDFSIRHEHAANVLENRNRRKLRFINSHVLFLNDDAGTQRGRLLTFLAKHCRQAMYIHYVILNIIAVTAAIAFAVAASFTLQRYTERVTFDSRGRGQSREYLFMATEALWLNFFCFVVLPIIINMSNHELYNSRRNRNLYFIVRLILFASISFIIYPIWSLDLAASIGGEICLEDRLAELIQHFMLQDFAWYCIFLCLTHLRVYALDKMYTEYLPSEPEMAPVLISLVYTNSLVCFVAPFAPCLMLLHVIIIILKLCLQLALFRLTDFGANERFEKEMEEFFLALYFAFFIMTAFTSLEYQFTVVPSISCGPFAYYADQVKAPYGLVIQGSAKDQYVTNFIWRVVFSHQFGVLISLVMIAIAFLFHSWHTAHTNTLHLLAKILYLERKDRTFIMRKIYHTVAGQAAPFTLTLINFRIYKIKVIFIAALIVGGRRYRLASQYRDYRHRKTTSVGGNGSRGSLRGSRVSVSKEVIEAYRQSLALQFLRHTDAIRLAHIAARKRLRRQWIKMDAYKGRERKP